MSEIAEIKTENRRGTTKLKITAKSEPKPPAITEQDLLQLHQRWQLTLDPQQLINYFAAELHRFVAYDSFEFQNPDAQLHLLQGSHKTHRCNYNLILEEEKLGELELTRNKRFSEDELYTLERILGSVVYSIRNTLHHHKALKKHIQAH